MITDIAVDCSPCYSSIPILQNQHKPIFQAFQQTSEANSKLVGNYSWLAWLSTACTFILWPNTPALSGPGSPIGIQSITPPLATNIYRIIGLIRNMVCFVLRKKTEMGGHRPRSAHAHIHGTLGKFVRTAPNLVTINDPAAIKGKYPRTGVH